MFRKLEQIELVYPVTTHIQQIHKAPRRVRYLVVHHVRDLIAEPLTVEEYTRRPYVARSRWLITASEPGKRPRQFYVGSADNYRAPGVLRVGLYEPGETRPSILFGREYQPTLADRQALLRFAQQEANRHPGYDVRIFASDLRLIS